jgi:glucose-1-phosphate cytidylyltransferase
MGGRNQTKKELVEVGGRAILWHVMRIFAAYGHNHFVLTLGHRADEIKRYFLELQTSAQDFTLTLGLDRQVSLHCSPQENDWKITFADTGFDTEKGSRIYRAARYLQDHTNFFVTYGDGVGDVDIDALLAFHRKHGKIGSITGVRPRSQYGLIQVDSTNQVAGFEEKPHLDHWINGGFMVFQRKILDYFRGDSVDLEQDTLVRLAAEGELMMYRHTGFWRSMDTFKEAMELDAIWREHAPWKVW